MPGNLARGEAEAVAFRGQGKIKLRLSGLKAVIDIGHNRIVGKGEGQVLARSAKLVEVAMAEFHRQCRSGAGPTAIRLELQVFHPRDLAHFAPPLAAEFGGADGTDFGIG